MKVRMDRRNFLVKAAYASIFGSIFKIEILGAKEEFSSKSIFLLGHGLKPKSNLFDPSSSRSEPGEIRIKNITNSFSQSSIKVPFLPHGFCQNPLNKNIFCTFEKWGPNSATFDVQENKLVKKFQLPNQMRFFGHGCFGKTEKYVYASLMDDQLAQGFVGLFDPMSLKLLDRFATQGVYPHDCQWDSEESQIVVLNSRKKVALDYRQQVFPRADAEDVSSIVFLDPEKGTVRQIYKLNNIQGGYAHFLKTSKSFIFTGSAEMKDGKSIPMAAVRHNADGIIKPLYPFSQQISKKDYKGEALSMIVNESENLLALTLPYSDEVHIWDLKREQLLNSFKVKEPRGLCYFPDTKKIFISSASEAKLHMIDRTFQKLEELNYAEKWGGRGSHLYFYKV